VSPSPDTSAPVPMADLPKEYADLKEVIDPAIARVVASGIFTLGPELDSFETALATYCGVSHAVGVKSGTAALHLALIACGIGPGNEVVTVTNTDNSTTAAVRHCGAELVFADIDARTFNLDPAELIAKVTPRTRAIVPVHMFGHPADMDPIMEIAREHDLLVIEDAALATGARYRGRQVGTFGDAAIISFAPTKILGAYGDGGAVLTNDDEIADAVRLLRDYGHDQHAERTTGGQSAIPIKRRMAAGFNERLDEIQAAILLAKLPTVDERIERRREIAEKYRAALAGLPVEPAVEASDVRHVYRAFTVLLDDRDRVREELAQLGIDTQIYYAPPLHLEPAYAAMGHAVGDFPISERIAARMMHLPIYPQMTDDQVDQVVAALADCLS
jgi:dTDP-4-amino-4,6-dideoxygalactose transaminase